MLEEVKGLNSMAGQPRYKWQEAVTSLGLEGLQREKNDSGAQKPGLEGPGTTAKQRLLTGAGA